MTDRDQWTETLRCSQCGKMGSVDLSQASGQAFHDGDQTVRVESVSEGFKAIQLEYGSNFYCSSCDSPVIDPLTHPKMPEHDADRFRKHADECREQAEKAVSPLDKEAWLRFAEDWIKLAVSAEERSQSSE